MGPTNVYLIDDSRPHLMSDSRCGIVWSRAASDVSGHKSLCSTTASEGREEWHEHFVDDVNDPVISSHVGSYDGRTVDLNAF